MKFRFSSIHIQLKLSCLSSSVQGSSIVVRKMVYRLFRVSFKKYLGTYNLDLKLSSGVNNKRIKNELRS